MHPLFWLAFCLVGGRQAFGESLPPPFLYPGKFSWGIFPYAHRKKSGDKRNYWNIEKRNESVIL